MSQSVQRPLANKKKIHSKNEFELCYLRHRYLRRANVNPTEEEMAPYRQIVGNLARNTFFTYRSLFHLVGLESEDLINIGNTHLVSYLGLFSVEKMSEEKMKAFVDAFYEKNKRDPEEVDFLNKNKANFTLFLKQRMEDVVRVCRQKARNIKGLPTEEFYAFMGTKRPPMMISELVENYEKLGFKKIDMATYKTAKKRAKDADGNVFKLDNRYFVAVPLENRSLNLVDFVGAGYNPYDNLHNMTPEQLLENSENNMAFEENRVYFDRISKTQKIKKIRSFIEENKKNPRLQEEIQVARKLLKNMGA